MLGFSVPSDFAHGTLSFHVDKIKRPPHPSFCLLAHSSSSFLLPTRSLGRMMRASSSFLQPTPSLPLVRSMMSISAAEEVALEHQLHHQLRFAREHLPRLTRLVQDSCNTLQVRSNLSSEKLNGFPPQVIAHAHSSHAFAMQPRHSTP